MVYSHSRKNDRKYPYYVCLNAQRKGWATCPGKSHPARAIEESVLKRLREAQPARFGAFEWEQMDCMRQVEAIQLFVERVGYDGAARQISIRLRPVPIPGEGVSA
jgi:nitroreductase